MNILTHTPYPDINNLLTEWTREVSHILGNNKVGLYLSGSLTYGDFVPARSDVDLQDVVHHPLSHEDLKSVEQLHKDLSEGYPLWGGRMECSYVPMSLMHETLPPQAPRPWWGFDRLYAEAHAGNEWIINHYFLSTYGIALAGPEFHTLVPPIDMNDVRSASARDLTTEWKPKISDAQWLSNPHHQAYLVLNICRILRTVVGEGPSSKKVATTWTKSEYPQWTDLIEEAEKWGYGKEMKRDNDAVRFVSFAIAEVAKSNPA